MALLDLSSDNPNLSYILAKNPATQAAKGAPFEVALRKGSVYGWFLADPRTFRLWFKDADQECSFVTANTQFEYLDQTRHASPYAFAGMVNELLGTALKAGHPEDVGYPATLVAHAMLLPRPGLAPLFHRYLSGQGLSVSAERLSGRLHRVTVSSVRGVRVALNALVVFAMLQALADKSLYVEASTPALQKYIRALNIIEAPYFMRYLFSRDAVQSFEQFRELAPTLALEGMRLNYGSTQQHRWDAIRVHLRGGDTLVDIGAGEGFYLQRLVPKYERTVAYERDEALMAKTQAYLERKGVAEVEWAGEFQAQDVPEGADVLLTEVVEHQPLEASAALLEHLARSAARRVVVTAPNREFNPHYALDGEMRHPDHHFEPNEAEFRAMLAPFETGWTCALSGIGDQVAGVPASWMAVLTRPGLQEVGQEPIDALPSEG